MKVVGLSVLMPGLGHLLSGQRLPALTWFLVSNALLFAGFFLAGATQFDYGFEIFEGSFRLRFLFTLPESLNIGGVLVAGNFFDSVESGGLTPTNMPWRHLGHLLSAMGGILGAISAAHAAGTVVAQSEPCKSKRMHPGTVALASMLLPGAGHWLIGRRFKAQLLGGTVIGLFLLGLALGHFADFDRQRHAYYWIGQMLLGLPAWLLYLPLTPLAMGDVFLFQDTGYTFTTVAGLFNVVIALDAYHRAESDWLQDARQGKPSETKAELESVS